MATWQQGWLTHWARNGQAPGGTPELDCPQVMDPWTALCAALQTLQRTSHQACPSEGVTGRIRLTSGACCQPSGNGHRTHWGSCSEGVQLRPRRFDVPWRGREAHGTAWRTAPGIMLTHHCQVASGMFRPSCSLQRGSASASGAADSGATSATAHAAGAE